MFTEKELVRVAKRENNNKRSYLVVNNLQAKHIPASPVKTLEMFDELSEMVSKCYAGEKLLVIGFAETATAIGARLAVKLNSMYMQTTREKIENVEYLYFTESHSHVIEQKIVKDDLDCVIGDVDCIIFAEDELTTGNTIMKIIRIIKNTYAKNIKFAAASLLNGMDREALEAYNSEGIEIHYLVKTDHSAYSDIAEQYAGDGEYITEYPKCEPVSQCVADGYLNARRLVSGQDYQKACDYLWKKIAETEEFNENETCLVIGTEECMYPAIYVAEQIEKKGCETRCHSTTRSPIAVSKETDYPLHCRYALRSLYDEERNTYLYDIAAYDKVLIISDAANPSEAGLKDLCSALNMKDNKNIKFVRWCRQ